MRSPALLLSGAALASAALASSGCRDDEGVDDAANGWGDESQAEEPEPEPEPVDCDDSGDDPSCVGHEPHDPYDENPGGPEPACEIEFPSVEPIWLVEEPSLVEGGLPTVLDLLVTDDALYVANWHNANDAGRSLGSLERRTLDGALVWGIELERAPSRLAWDGQQLYAALGHELRRWSPDGAEDEWRYAARGPIRDIAVSEDSVALVGSYTAGGVHDAHSDAFFGTLDKTLPVDYRGYAMPTEGVDDIAEAIAVNPWGGWIAAGSSWGAKEHVWLRGYAGHRLVASMQNFPGPHVEAMFPGDDLLYVVGWANASNSGQWVSAIDDDGVEQWSRDLWICPDARGAFRDLTFVDDTLIGLGTSRNAADEYPPLIVKTTLDDFATEVWKVEDGDRHFSLSALAVDGSRLLVGGWMFTDGHHQRVIAELRPFGGHS
jgi:hypothetical protein